VEYRYGDVAELAAELPPPDIVTLDSVVCCYPYLPALLGAAVKGNPRLVGRTYPRDVWWMRVYMRIWNVAQALRRSRARYFIHRHAVVNRLMAEAGFENAHDGGTREWRVVLYRHA
jgi:magnesium-protoporphyrin O-methyltransferase